MKIFKRGWNKKKAGKPTGPQMHMTHDEFQKWAEEAASSIGWAMPTASATASAAQGWLAQDLSSPPPSHTYTSANTTGWSSSSLYPGVYTNAYPPPPGGFQNWPYPGHACKYCGGWMQGDEKDFCSDKCAMCYYVEKSLWADKVEKFREEHPEDEDIKISFEDYITFKIVFRASLIQRRLAKARGSEGE
jgi:hypothetical protein